MQKLPSKNNLPTIALFTFSEILSESGSRHEELRGTSPERPSDDAQNRGQTQSVQILP
jgi:hypothetical protein